MKQSRRIGVDVELVTIAVQNSDDDRGRRDIVCGGVGLAAGEMHCASENRADLKKCGGSAIPIPAASLEDE